MTQKYWTESMNPALNPLCKSQADDDDRQQDHIFEKPDAADIGLFFHLPSLFFHTSPRYGRGSGPPRRDRRGGWAHYFFQTSFPFSRM